MTLGFSRKSLGKILKYKILWKSAQWKTGYSMGTYGGTNRQADMTYLLAAFRNFGDALYKLIHNRLVSSYQLNAHFLYSITIYMLHYNPQHVSSYTLLIFRRTNYIITASGIVTLCKRPYTMPVESGLSPLSTGILYGCLQRVAIPEGVIIQFVLLKVSKVLLETCWGL